MDFTFGELVDEAAERAGLDPAALTARHLNSIRRSVELLMVEIENAGAKPEYRVDTFMLPLTKGQPAVMLPADTIDVLQVQYRNAQGLDQPISRTTRQDYQMLANKAQTGVGQYPMQFWLSKSVPTELFRYANVEAGWGDTGWGDSNWGGTTSEGETAAIDRKLLILWPLPGLEGTLVIDRLREHGNYITGKSFGSALDTRRKWLETMCRGLAAKIAEKYNPEREDSLRLKFEVDLRERMQSEDRGSVIVGFRGFGRSRQRRF